MSDVGGEGGLNVTGKSHIKDSQEMETAQTKPHVVNGFYSTLSCLRCCRRQASLRLTGGAAVAAQQLKLPLVSHI